MSLHVDAIHLIERKASILGQHVLDFLQSWEERLPEDCFLEDLRERAEREPNKHIRIKNFNWYGEGSRSLETALIKLAPLIKGTLRGYIVWDDGYEPEPFFIRDGKLVPSIMVVDIVERTRKKKTS